MKKLLLSFWLLLLAFTSVGKDAGVALFEKANRLYEAGKFEEAMPLYHAVQQKNGGTAELYNNLALTYLQTNDQGRAAWYIQKARYLAPLDAEIYRNAGKIMPAAKEPVKAGFLNFPDPAPELVKGIYWGFLLASGLLTLGSIAFFSAVWLKPGTRATSLKKAGANSGIIGVLVALLCLAGLWYLKPAANALVILESTSGHSGPSAGARNTVTFAAGETAVPTNTYRGWYNLRSTTGRQGWVLKKYLGRIAD